MSIMNKTSGAMFVKTLEIGPKVECPFCDELVPVDKVGTHCGCSNGHDGVDTLFWNDERYVCPFEDCIRKTQGRGRFQNHLRNRHNASMSSAYAMLKAEGRFDAFQASLQGGSQ